MIIKTASKTLIVTDSILPAVRQGLWKIGG